jgi:hypothetical protein
MQCDSFRTFFVYKSRKAKTQRKEEEAYTSKPDNKSRAAASMHCSKLAAYLILVDATVGEGGVSNGVSYVVGIS